jgi:DnaJ-class molecular chaperone
MGFSRILLTHLDGRGVHVSSPPGKIIRPGDTIVLRGEGMPTYKRPDQKGDMYVVFEVEFPSDSWLQTADTKVCVVISKIVPVLNWLFIIDTGVYFAPQESRCRASPGHCG